MYAYKLKFKEKEAFCSDILESCVFVTEFVFVVKMFAFL